MLRTATRAAPCTRRYPRVVCAFDGVCTTHPYRLRPTDEIIIAQFGRVQGAALVAVRDIYMMAFLRTAPNLPSRALQPSVIHALFIGGLRPSPNLPSCALQPSVIHALFVRLAACGRPLTLPSRALHPSVIQPLFVCLAAIL